MTLPLARVWLFGSGLLGVALLTSASHAQGWKREPAQVYQSFPQEPIYRAFLPAEADLSARFPTPGDQGQQGSCVAWATGYALRTYYEGLIQGWDLNVAAHQVSPASIYNRLTDDPAKCSDGTAISDALKLLHHDGAVDLASLPYSPNTCGQVPSGMSAGPPNGWRITDWHSVNMSKLDNVKGEVAKGNPVVFGMDYSKSLLDLKAGAIYDDVDSPRAGGHAMVIVGYSDARQAFKIMNSWGTRWADNGFGWISYRAVGALSDRGFVVSVAGKPAPLPPQPVIPPTPPPPTPPPAVVAENVPPPTPTPTVTPAPTVRPPVEVPVVFEPAVPVEPLPPAPAPHKPKPAISESPRAKVMAEIADLACAKVDVAPATGPIARISGFVPNAGDKTRIAALLGKDGAQMTEGLKVYAWPQCEALQTFAPALAKDAGLAVQVVGAQPAQLTAGDSVVVEVTTPSFPAYLYATYLQVSGDAVHLAQPVGLAPQRFAPGTKVRLGGGGTQPTYRVGPPFGREMIMVIASASPLFQTPRPPTEIERDYLTAFRLAFLEKPKPGMPDRVVAAAFTTLATHPKGP
jgi:hypothetical protein